MENEILKSKTDSQTISSVLERILKSGKNLLIVTHNNPDPDAIASAYALKYFTERGVSPKTSFGSSISTLQRKERNLLLLRRCRSGQTG